MSEIRDIMSWLESMEGTPIQGIEPEGSESQKSGSLVDEIIKVGEDPNIPNEPEEQFGLPKQLSTIAGLRKKGFDNATIFKAMELEEAEAASSSTKAETPPIEKSFIGPMQRQRTTGEKVKEQFKRTSENSKLDQLFYQSYHQMPGSPSFEEVTELINEYEERVQNDPVEADNWLEYILLASSGLAGTMKQGVVEGIPSATAGATGAALMGNLSPLAVVPEEFATVPIGFGTGMAVGSTIFWQQQGSGMMMRNMMSRGVDPNTSAILANMGGLFYGLVERLQVSKVIPKSMQKKANDIIAKGITSTIAKWGKEYGKDWAIQIGQEELQLAIELLTTELGATLEGVERRTWESMVEEAWETAKQTGAGLIPMQGGRAAVDVSVQYGPAKIKDMVSGLLDTNKELEESIPIVSKEEKLTIESQVKEITEDQANDFNIQYDAQDSGSKELSEDEIIATGYNIDLNELPETRKDENGKKFYAVRIKGETDSEGNIRLTSSADRSTVLEEAIEARLKRLQKSKKAEDKRLIEKINFWTESVRKKARKMGLNLRFTEEGEGNIELFSDAILYTKGGFKGLSKEFEDAIYIPEDISSEFIAKFGEMSDGSSVFEMLQGSEKGIQENQEFASAVDSDIQSQMDKAAKKTRPPPAKPPIKSKLGKTTKQMVPGEVTKTSEFKSWFGDSKAVDENNQPLVVYHGTTQDFDTFDIDKAGVESHLGKGFYFSDSIDDVNRNYGTEEGPDLTNKIERLAEQDENYGQDENGDRVIREKIKNQLSQNQGNIMPVYLSMKNPVDLDDRGTYLEPGYEYDEEYDDYIDDEDSPAYKMIEAIPLLSREYDTGNWADIQAKVGELVMDGIYAKDLIEQLKKSDELIDIYDENNGDLATNDFIKELFKAGGFDGFMQKNADKDFTGMDMNYGTNHYIVFEPNQIKSAIGNKGTFDPGDARITYQLEPDVIKKAVGLYPDVMSTKAKADRLRLTVERREKTPLIGRQNNNRVEFKLKNGGIMILGRDKTPEDWIRQVESMLDQDEVMTAMNWYEEAYPAFVEEFGETEAVNYMVAWLLGNVQASPQQALSNTFLGSEQLKAELPSWKSAGTAMVSRNIKDTLSGKQAESGAGAKLYDFLDSALGKSTRTIMQDDKKGLAPVAIDRHTYRDAGFVDGNIRNILKRLAIDTERVKRLRFDSRGSSPTDTQYEYAVKYMNDLTDQLNEMGYMGGNLKPHQVQAIGWTAIARMAESSEGQSIPDALQLQRPTVNFKIDFAEESPYKQKFGNAFDELTPNQKDKLSNNILNNVVQPLAKDLGLKVNSVSGSNINVRGSSQAIKGLMNSIGFIMQKDEVGLTSRGSNLKGLGLVYSNPELSNPAMQKEVFDILQEETDKKLSPRAFYEEVDGVPSLLVTTDLLRTDIMDNQDQISSAVERVRNELGLELNLSELGTKYESTKNNWKKDNTGQRYRDKILETHQHSLLERLDNSYGPNVEQEFRRAFTSNAKQQRKSRQLIPDPDYAAELQAGQEQKSYDLNNTNDWKGIIRTKLYDKLDAVVSWQKDIEEQRLGGNRLRDHLNVSLAAELYVGRVPELLKDYNKKIIDLNNKDSFIYRLNKSGITIEDFNQYLHALHAKERNDKMGEDGLSNMTNQQARTTKAELNKKYGLKNLKQFVREFRKDIVDASLQMRLDNGLIDQESFDNMKKTYKNYVPLFRVFDGEMDKMDQSKKGLGKFNIFGPEFKKAKGSKRPVKNILVSSIEQYHEAVIRSEKNKVNKRLMDLIESFPNDAFEVRGLKHKPVYNEDGEIDYMVPVDKARRDEKYIHVKVDGKVKQIVFKGEQGVRIANAMLDLGENRGIKYLYAINNYLRYVNTIADPRFMVTNFIRDIQTAGINITAEQGGNITTQALSPKNLKNAWKAVFNVAQKGEMDSEWGQLYDKMRLAGGKTGFFDYETIEDKVIQVEKDLKRVESTGRGVKVAGSAIFNFIENLNEATESAVRLTLFKAMLDHGYSTEQAASGAKNVTINFNRKGEWGQTLNSFYLFANAGLQGTGRIFGVVANSRKAQAAVAGLATLGFTEAFYNRMGDDDEEYDKMTTWDKDNNFIVRYGDGDKFFKMRLPYGYNVFKVVGNIAGDIAWKQMNNEPIEPVAQMVRFMEAANTAFNPLGSGPLEQVISPTVSDPLVQLSTNREFHGGPIRPVSVYGPAKAEVEQAWERTPEVYKNMSQWLFKSQNGTIRYNPDGSIKSAVRGLGPFGNVSDISPETIEYFVQYLGGGLGKTIATSINTVQGTIKKDADYTKSPFVSTFFGKFDKKSEARSLYTYEKDMKRQVFDEPTRLKYLRYLESYYKKGNLTPKEYRQRYKRFIKAQRYAERNLD